MITQINRTLSKQISHITTSLSQKESYSAQDITKILANMQKNLQESFVTVMATNDIKLSESKNQLKKKNKSFNQLQLVSQKKEFDLVKENGNLREELQRSHKKVHNLLRLSQNYQKTVLRTDKNEGSDKGTQCQMKDQQMEKIIEEVQKQNIQLKQRIVELQQINVGNKQDLQAANTLIKELIKQLETNVADRQTWNGTGSSNASELDSLDRQNESIEFIEQSSSSQNEVSQSSSVCARLALRQDCSTIDGSNTTTKDFALPEWLQFDQSIQKKTMFIQEHTQFNKMWPQLIWNRFRQFYGWSYEL